MLFADSMQAEFDETVRNISIHLSKELAGDKTAVFYFESLENMLPLG